MKQAELKKVHESLSKLKRAMHDTANTSAVSLLEKAIGLIEEGMANNASATDKVKAAMLVIAELLSSLASLSEIIHSLMK